jgi:hypothetical protein
MQHKTHVGGLAHLSGRLDCAHCAATARQFCTAFLRVHEPVFPQFPLMKVAARNHTHELCL